MKGASKEADVIDRLVQWANSQPLVRALLLESSRASDRAPVDILSDYDVLLVVSDMRPFSHDETWSEFASTYVGEDIDENWDALFKTTGLFRRIAIEVGDALGYSYPYDLDDHVTRYLQSIRNLER